MLGPMMLAGIGALCLSNPRRKKRRAKSRRVYRRNPALTSAENLTVLRDALTHRFPFVRVNRMTLGGEERASFSISVSLDPRESWANGIYQNSRFRQFMVNADGSMYEISGSDTPRFRKTKVKEITDVVRKLDAWKPQTNPRRSHTGRKITKKQWYADGAWSNSNLYRIQKGGRWHYYRTNPRRRNPDVDRLETPRAFFVDDKRFVDTLFQGSRSAAGTFKVKRNGILFSTPAGEPFAFLVANKRGENFFVSAGKQPDGRIRYMFSTTDRDKKRLGLEGLGYAAEHELAAKLWAKHGTKTNPRRRGKRKTRR